MAGDLDRWTSIALVSHCDSLTEDRGMQDPQNLTRQILRLSPEQRAAVEEFVNTLLRDTKPLPTFREALDRFKREHPELLRLLAQ